MKFEVIDPGKDILEIALDNPENICLMCGINSQQHSTVKDPPPTTGTNK